MAKRRIKPKQRWGMPHTIRNDKAKDRVVFWASGAARCDLQTMLVLRASSAHRSAPAAPKSFRARKLRLIVLFGMMYATQTKDLEKVQQLTHHIISRQLNERFERVFATSGQAELL